MRSVRWEQGRQLAIVGGAVGGAGLVLGAVGFGIFGAIHAENPGPGLSLQFDDDPAQGQRTLRLARTTGALGMAGGVLLLSGGILATIGLVRMHRSGGVRAERFAFGLAPGLRSLAVVGRF